MQKLKENLFKELSTQLPKGLIFPKPTVYDQLILLYPPHPIKSEKDYKNSLIILEKIILFYHQRKSKLSKSIKDGFVQYLTLLSSTIEAHESQKYDSLNKKLTDKEILKFLMDQQGVVQADLAKELGGQSIVSNILTGKRELNKKQIAQLSERFSVSPAVFFRR